MTRSWLLRVALLGCVACLVGCDHASKVVAEAALRHAAPLVIVPGVVDLQYTENRDVAFDMFSRLSLHPPVWVLGVIAVLTAAIVLIAWLRRQNATWVEHTAFALVCAGAIGNAMDRLVRGHVVDFIHVRFWPVFNLADALVVAGVGLLMLGLKRTPPSRVEGAS